MRVLYTTTGSPVLVKFNTAQKIYLIRDSNFNVQFEKMGSNRITLGTRNPEVLRELAEELESCPWVYVYWDEDRFFSGSNWKMPDKFDPLFESSLPLPVAYDVTVTILDHGRFGFWLEKMKLRGWKRILRSESGGLVLK